MSTPHVWKRAGALVFALAASSTPAFAGEADIKIPDLTHVHFDGLGGVSGVTLMYLGILLCIVGAAFGLVQYTQTKALQVHKSMADVSHMIWETCKTYLFTQGKFILILWAFIAIVISIYFGVLSPVAGKPVAVTLPIILLFSLVGIAGSYSVAWFGIRVNTFANSRTAFASLKGKAYDVYAIPLKSGMSIGTVLISVELIIMLAIDETRDLFGWR